MLLYIPENFTKPLEMHNLSHSQETNRIADLRILYHTKNIIIRTPGFLFCCNCERTTYHVKQIGQAAFIHAKTEY